MLRTSVLRSGALRSCVVRPALGVTHHQAQQQRNSSATAISNPTLADIEKRWETMPPQEQADLWMALRDRMKVNWSELTLQEKKAAYWIAFGAHGPRAVPPPGEGWKVAGYTFIGLGVSLVFFMLIRAGAGPAPATMTKEYEEATNEFLKRQKAEPITGISSEGYSGKGQVQSPPAKK
ncbi:mitochondrial cytochrome c oxidase-like protein subunit V [Xylogone sp. PMI_703]|nr:mitochondrial cytochrome c oxidase-like protein subunit V [Xylogone sp. PMI_703]